MLPALTSMSILLPLYIYPTPGAWDPLYAAYVNIEIPSIHALILISAQAHRNVDFTVILNPCSGPCLGSLPDQVYLDEVPKLRLHPNIRTLGYVATHYTDKPIESVLTEIDIYSRWPKIANETGFRVDGIFLDETPSTYSTDEYEYLKVAAQAVRNGTTFKDRLIGK
jgi:hypothetical protein